MNRAALMSGLRSAYSRSIGFADVGIPVVFQILEWLLIASALRWAAGATRSDTLNVLAWLAVGFLSAFCVRQLGRIGWFTHPGSESHGQPRRLVAAWIAATISVVLLAFVLMTFIDACVSTLMVINSGEPATAPPSYPPETAEKTVNETGGQTTPEAQK